VDQNMSTSPNQAGDAGDQPAAEGAAVGQEAGPGAASPAGPGRIVLAATPIGNVGDASSRLIELLTTADIVAAEDTRRLHRLVQNLGVTVGGRVISYHEHNEVAKTAELLEQVRSGKTTDRFCFEGFLPRKAGERSSRLADLDAERRTMVFFEAPHRLEPMLRALRERFGADRPAAVCRELTKTYEEVIRGSLRELLEWAESNEVRGEIAVVVGGAPAREPGKPEDHVAAVNALIAQGIRLKEAVAAVAEDTRVSKRELYSAVLAAR
jgi:16S rRNA (cytidine1402-2'-O)-methyltransferase